MAPISPLQPQQPGIPGGRSTEDSAPASLERIGSMPIFRLHGKDELNLDRANMKHQHSPDGVLSFEDAEVRGISKEEWESTVNMGKSLDAIYKDVGKLFSAKDQKDLKQLHSGDLVVDVPAARATELDTALDTLREKIFQAQQMGMQVAYPERNGDVFSAKSVQVNQSTYVVDPKDLAALKMDPKEALWFFSELTSRTERVTLSDGRPHYLNPEMRKVLDERLSEIVKEVQTAHDAGKNAVYMSTFISSGDLKINRAIAGYVADQMQQTDRWGQPYVMNPSATQQAIPGAVGDDYMYLWHNLLSLNVFDAVRFTSAEDTQAYFKSIGKPVPSEYMFRYGDAMHSAGCRYERNIIARLNETMMAKPHHMVPMFYGEHPLDMGQLTAEVPTVDYDVRGEKSDTQ